jgi:hypothetical protein
MGKPAALGSAASSDFACVSLAWQAQEDEFVKARRPEPAGDPA